MPIKLNGTGRGSVALNAPANTSGGSDISDSVEEWLVR